MRISPISISTNYKMNSFKANQNKPQEQVQYSTWGDNYAYPVTQNDDIIISPENKEMDEEVKERILGKASQYDETPEEYYKRKLYSTEWTT